MGDKEPKTQPWPWTQDLASSDHHPHSLPENLFKEKEKAGWEEQLGFKVGREPSHGAFRDEWGARVGTPLSPGRAEEAQDGGGGRARLAPRSSRVPGRQDVNLSSSQTPGIEPVSNAHKALPACPGVLGPWLRGPGEDAEVRRESRGARREGWGCVVTVRTGVTPPNHAPHGQERGLRAPGRPGFKSRFSQPQLCVLGDLLCLSVPYFLLYQMGVKVPPPMLAVK